MQTDPLTRSPWVANELGHSPSSEDAGGHGDSHGPSSAPARLQPRPPGPALGSHVGPVPARPLRAPRTASRPATHAPRPGPPRPARGSGTFIGSARPRRWEVGAAALLRPRVCRGPPLSAFAMRPGAPGPLWPLPWGALAWAVGFVGSVGADPAPGEWGGRKGRGRATHVGLSGMRARGRHWGRHRSNPKGLEFPSPGPEGRVTRSSAEQM